MAMKESWVFCFCYMISVYLTAVVCCSSRIPVYFINLMSHQDRYNYTLKHLLHINIVNYTHIPAVTPTSQEFKQIKVLEKPCKRNTDYDVAVVMSHLKAIHTAIHDARYAHCKYALIIEDDVKFLYEIDFDKLICKSYAC